MKCICKGNWRLIVEEYKRLLGKWYVNRGISYRFSGIVYAEDDYYYLMVDRDGVVRLLSCVGSIRGHGFKRMP